MSDYYGGPALSFRPAAPSTKAWSRTLGVVLIAGALAFAGHTALEDRAAYPALASGHSTSGVFNEIVPKRDGDHATVTYMPEGIVLIATSIEPVSGLSTTSEGRSYKVFYGARGTTFIDGLDHVKVSSENFVGAGAAAFLGLIFILRPFKVPTRRKRQKPEGRHRD